MGCSACGSKPSNKVSKISKASVSSYSEECTYTVELMIIWKEKLNCIKENNLYSEVGFNKYKINFGIGYVQSAINTGKPCLFKKQLDEVNNIILSLINIEKC